MCKEYLWAGKAPYETDLRPSIEAHCVPGAKSAVVVCPGGGYTMKAIDHEGAAFCRLFNDAGYSAYQLDYRVRPCHYEAPLSDALRAMRMVRAKGYEKVGIIGFSAGGNLVCNVANFFDYGKTDAEDPIERVSSRPDALIACYAVVSFCTHAHEGSARPLLGEHYGEEALMHRFSAEMNVREDAPHAFIWHTVEDQAVPVENSLMLAQAYRAKRVPFEMHIFPQGAHGLGLAQDIPGACQWPQLMLDWLAREGF